MDTQTKINIHKKIQRLILVIGGSIALILILVIVINVVKYNHDTKRENLNIDQFIALTASHEFSKDISGEATFVSIDIKDKYIRVFLNKDAITADTYLYDVIEIMGTLTNDSEFLGIDCKGITFNYMVDVVDAYGNVSKPVCSTVTIDKQDFKKIKWDTVTAKGLEIVSEFWYDKNILKAK